LGYQQGIIDDSRNPEATREALLDNVLLSVGVSSRQHVHTVRDGDSSLLFASQNSQNKAVKRVAYIGRSIVQVAREYVKQQMQETAQNVRAKLPDDITEEQFLQVLVQNEEFQVWSKATQQLQGNWSYLLLETKLPNAFVSEILPKVCFASFCSTV
jgi:hypothetical protein